MGIHWADKERNRPSISTLNLTPKPLKQGYKKPRDGVEDALHKGER